MVIIWLMMVHIYIYIFAWWFEPPSLKNDGVKVSWDDDIPKRMESHNPVMFQTTNHSCFAGLWTLFFGQIIESVAADSFTTLLCL
jgi:hypothetical protein